MPYGNMSGGEDFVLGQSSAFGKDVAKEFKGSKSKDRQKALSTFMAQQGEKYRIEEKALNQAFESGSRLNNLMAGPYVAKATGGKYKGMKQPTGGTTTSEIASMVKDTPALANTMLLGGIIQSPVKVAGRVVEAVTGDETAGNRLSQRVLDEITAPSNARFTYGARGAMVNMSDDERRIAANKFYADQLKSNEEKAMAKEALAPDFTSDTTYGDVIDTASWFSPGSFLKGLKVTGKAGSMGVKAASMAPRPARIAGGLAAGAGAYAGYNQLKPEEAKAVSVPDFISLLKYGGKAEAARPGRNLATTVADRMFGTMRNRGGGGRIPVSEMTVRPDKDYTLQLVENDREWFVKNKDALDIYPNGKQEGHAVSASHPPGMDPSLAPHTLPDHFSGGKLNEIESKINAERRRLDLPAYTNYKDIITAAIEKANRGEFGANTFAASLKGKTLEEAQQMLGAVDIKYW